MRIEDRRAAMRNQLSGILLSDAGLWESTAQERNRLAELMLERLDPLYREQFAAEVRQVKQAPQTQCSERAFEAARNRIASVIRRIPNQN